MAIRSGVEPLLSSIDSTGPHHVTDRSGIPARARTWFAPGKSRAFTVKASEIWTAGYAGQASRLGATSYTLVPVAGVEPAYCAFSGRRLRPSQLHKARIGTPGRSRACAMQVRSLLPEFPLVRRMELVNPVGLAPTCSWFQARTVTIPVTG